MPDEPENTLDPASHVTRRDPRFAAAPMTAAEMKSLHQATTPDEAFAILGRLQEERTRDGRLPPVPAPPASQAPLFDQYIPREEQVRLAMRPTPGQLARLRAAHTTAAEHDATIQFMAERKAQNEQWFERSRHWGHEIDRQTSHDDRLRTARGIQGWRDTPRAQDRTGEPRSFAEQLAAAGPAPDREPARDEGKNTAPTEMTDRQQRRAPHTAPRDTASRGPAPERGNER